MENVRFECIEISRVLLEQHSRLSIFHGFTVSANTKLLTTHFHAKVSLLDGLTQYSSYNHGWPENRFIMSIKKNVAI